MLSERAQQYVATFERHPSVPLEDVKRWFAESGEPCFDVWMEFHQRYAGLKDRATGYILGLAQPVDPGNPAHRPRVDCDDWGQDCSVLIAEVEGDEKYELNWRGQVRFDSERADSFERRLERDALLWEFRQRKTDYIADDHLCQSLLPQLENDWVPEASDEYVDCYRNSRYLLFVNARTRYVDDVYECIDPVFVSYSGGGRRKPEPTYTPRGPGPAFLPISIFGPYAPSADPYRRLVERLSLLGNLTTWDPQSVARALDVELTPLIEDPSSPERRYTATDADVFEKIRFIVPTFRSPVDYMLLLTPQILPPADPVTVLAPLLPHDSHAELAWPQKQDGIKPKQHSRALRIGENEIEFVFAGDDFAGPQRLTHVSFDRPRRTVDSKRFEFDCYHVEALGGAAYSIRRMDDGSETVRVVAITEDPGAPDRLTISFRCLDHQITIQDGSRLITTLIVQGIRRELYIGRVEYLDYKELDSDLEYTRLWNQRADKA